MTQLEYDQISKTTKKHTFPRPLEEEPHDKYLQPSHRHHHQALQHAKVENPSFRAPNSAEVPVLTRPEVFLVPRNSRQLR